MQNVIPPAESFCFLNGVHIRRVFHHTDQLGVARLIRTDPTRGFFREGQTDRAIDDLAAGFL